MLGRLRSHLTFANVVSMMALFVALSSGAYALTIPQNSIGARQLKKNAVTSSKLKKNAVTSSKVKDRSLLASDFKAGQLPAGAQGAPGAPGTPGLQGATGERGLQGAAGATNVVVRFGTPVSIPAGSQQSVTVNCQAGERAVSGGVAPPSGISNDLARIIYSTPLHNGGNANNGDVPDGWNTRVFNGAGLPQDSVPRVVCASP
jgi:hypothetical protein